MQEQIEITQQKWLQVAEIEIVYNIKIKPSLRPRITSSKDMYELLIQHWNNDLIDLQEHFIVMLLNRRNRVLGIYRATIGGISQTVVDARLIIAVAIKSGATAIIISHNHPSGSRRPSEIDEILTQKIKTAVSYFDIVLLDHIIVTSESFFSMADEGLL